MILQGHGTTEVSDPAFLVLTKIAGEVVEGDAKTSGHMDRIQGRRPLDQAG